MDPGDGAAAAEGLEVRRLAPSDLPLLSRWLENPDVSRYFTESADMDNIAAKYGSRIAELRGDPPLRPGLIVPNLVLREGRPIGYGQYYLLTPGDLASYRLPAGSSWGGFDLFIGEPALWGRGIGTALVTWLLERLQSAGAAAVAIDTWVGNARAIRCYEKAGLRKAWSLPRHETWQGQVRDHVVMVWRPPGGEAPPDA